MTQVICGAAYLSEWAVWHPELVDLAQKYTVPEFIAIMDAISNDKKRKFSVLATMSETGRKWWRYRAAMQMRIYWESWDDAKLTAQQLAKKYPAFELRERRDAWKTKPIIKVGGYYMPVRRTATEQCMYQAALDVQNPLSELWKCYSVRCGKSY